MKLQIKKLSHYMIAVIAAWAVFAVVVGGGYFMLYVPQKTELIQLQNQCAESQRGLNKAQLAAQEQTKEKMRLRREETDRLIAGFSTEHDRATELIFEVGQIANDLRLAEFSSKRRKQKDRATIGKSEMLSEAWLTVEFFATFDQFAQFLNRLERHCPIVFIEELSLRRAAAGSRGHEVSLQLSFLAEQNTKSKKVVMAAR
ncbi:MAG: GspMb/PilO family protein [Planctomycetota bacterium]